MSYLLNFIDYIGEILHLFLNLIQSSVFIFLHVL